MFTRNEKTLVTFLSLILAVSTVTAFTQLTISEKFRCDTRHPGKKMDCWHYQDENVGMFATQGEKSVMEDEVIFEKNIDGTKLSIYGVLDGTGNGNAVKFVADNLMDVLREELKKAEGLYTDEIKKNYVSLDYGIVLKKTLEKMEEMLLKEMDKEGDNSGTTVLLALIDEEEKFLYVANVGDSRALMNDQEGRTYRLSNDHTPGTASERKRIEKAGGTVECENNDCRVDNFNMSRLLGCKHKKGTGHIIADPDTFFFDLSRFKPHVLVLTSDGILDDFVDKDIVRDAQIHLAEPKEYFGAEAIGKLGYTRGSYDNIAVLVVKMPQFH